MATTTHFTTSAGVWATDVRLLILTCILRFADPDLMMRYHWGLGVGHYHAHQTTSTSTSCHATNKPGVDQDEQISNMKLDSSEETSGNVHPKDRDDELANDVLELSLEDRHLEEEGWQSCAETDSLSDDGHGGSDPEDVEYTGL
jgi:hypothetical protein